MTIQLPWDESIQRISSLLKSLEITSFDGKFFEPQQGFLFWQQRTQEVRDSKNKVFFIGNGASASMASHFSADLAKNGQIHTQVFTDLSLITAIGNDLGFDYVFSVPFSRQVHTDDMLIAISCSGESPNILNTIRIARDIGIFCVSLTGKNAKNSVRQLCNLNFYIPAESYGECESCHAVILHYWMDAMQVK